MRRQGDHPPVFRTWDGFAAVFNDKSRVVEIFKQYNADMQKAGRPYRYS
jgi:hypothetical protein